MKQSIAGCKLAYTPWVKNHVRGLLTGMSPLTIYTLKSERVEEEGIMPLS